MSNMSTQLMERESILSLKANLSTCGNLERRPADDICRHVLQYARDHPRGDNVYKTPNLIRVFNTIVNNKAFGRAVTHARSEPYEIKTSLQDPCTSNEESKKASRDAAKRKRELSGPRPANDVFVHCQFYLTVGNYFAFAIVALIVAPKSLIAFAIEKPCDKCEEASHSSDACEKCLSGFAYNLRKARVAIASKPFTIATTCVAVHEH